MFHKFNVFVEHIDTNEYNCNMPNAQAYYFLE